MMQMSPGSVESDLSKLLLLASDPEASAKIAAQLQALVENRELAAKERAELAAKERELDERQKRLDAVEAKAEETAALQAKTEQTNREVTRVLDQRLAAITERETTTFAAREEKLKSGEVKLARLREQIDAQMARFRDELAAL